MNSHDRAVSRFRRRLAAVYFLKHTLAGLTAWAFVWGTAVVALRAAAGVRTQPLLWGFAGVPAAAVWGLVVTYRRLPSPAAVRALLDRHTGAGGLFMAAGECGMNGWERSVPSTVNLRCRWQGDRAVALFAAGAAFLLVSFLVPERMMAGPSPHRLEIDREADALADQVAVLRQESVLEPARADALQEKLDQVKQNASGEAPVKTLEALDHLANLTRQAGNEAAEKAVRQTERLSDAETLAGGLRDAAGEVSPKVETEAMAELAEMMKKAAAETKALDRHLGEQLGKACRSGSLSRDELKKLGEALRAGKKDLESGVKKLHEARLVEADKLRECKKAGESNAKELAAFLRENKGTCSAEEVVSRCRKPGRGGVSRGPGEAPLTWKDPTAEKDERFRPETLPPAQVSALKDSQVGGVSAGKPQARAAVAPSQPGALAGAAAGGGSANTQVILPRHRGVVGRYFERGR